MRPIRLMLCGFITLLSCSAWAGVNQFNDNTNGQRNVHHKQERLAGRANLVNNNDRQTRNPPAQNSTSISSAHEKSLMSKEERRDLRRQINETESKYPRNK